MGSVRATQLEAEGSVRARRGRPRGSYGASDQSEPQVSGDMAIYGWGGMVQYLVPQVWRRGDGEEPQEGGRSRDCDRSRSRDRRRSRDRSRSRDPSRDRDQRRDRGQIKDTQNHPTHTESETGLAGENQEALSVNQGSLRREEEENRDRAGQRKRTHSESESGR